MSAEEKERGIRSDGPGPRPRRDSEAVVEVESLGSNGRGVARLPSGMAVFVEDGLPGQQVRIRLRKVKKHFAEARIEEILRESPARVEPRCRHFFTCGGCRLQHLDYRAQVAEKGEQVRDALERIGGFEDPPMRPPMGSPQEWGYRNKMEYSFGDVRWLSREELDAAESRVRRDFALGLHPRGRWERILHLEECHLPHPRSVEILREVQEQTGRSRHRPYSPRTHKGYWRYLITRQGVRTGQWMADIVTADIEAAHGEVEDLARRLRSDMPWITTVTHTLNRGRATVANGEEERVLEGPGWIEEEVGGLLFRLSPRSFFQTNTEGAERLYEQAVSLAELEGDEVVWDLYCGTGTIALLMARRARRVLGIEAEPSSIIDARANAERNAIENVAFLQGESEKVLREDRQLERPDVVVVDPPRAGLHPDVRRALADSGASRIVYVSCNPATLARDLKEICGNHYRLELVQPIDMFPHTPHVECAVRLSAR